MRPDWTKPRRDSTNLIDLSTNICYDHHVEREINSFLNEYPISVYDFADELPLYNVISTYHQVPIKNITLGFGLGELYPRIVQMLQHHKFAILQPTWEFASVACDTHNVPWDPIRDIKTPSSASVLYVANPSGVTGEIIDRYKLLGLAKKYNVVIVDESYSEYSIHDQSLVQHIGTDNIIILKTLSKSLGVAGLRVGYAIANASLTERMQCLRPSSVTTSVASALAPKLFNMIPNHIGRMLHTREWLREKYKLQDTNGNYVLFDTLPIEINEKFKVKKQPNGYRMTVTNIERILNAINH